MAGLPLLTPSRQGSLVWEGSDGTFLELTDYGQQGIDFLFVTRRVNL